MNSRHILLVSAAFAGGLVGCTDKQAEPQTNSKSAEAGQLVGGWQATTVTDELRQAADFAVQAMGKSSAGIKAITDPRVQVVAGMNYAMTLELNDGTKWRATVYRALDGQMHLTESSRL